MLSREVAMALVGARVNYSASSGSPVERLAALRIRSRLVVTPRGIYMGKGAPDTWTEWVGKRVVG